MKSLFKILSYLVITIGILHITYSTQIYDEIGFNFLWFVSGGLAMIFFGLINLVFSERKPSGQTEKLAWITPNILMILFIGLGIYVMNDVVTYIIAGLIITINVSAFMKMGNTDE